MSAVKLLIDSLKSGRQMPSDVEVVIMDLVVSSNPTMNANGGDYDEGVGLVVKNGRVIAGHHWSSSDFDYCPGCGTYGHTNCTTFDMPADWT